MDFSMLVARLTSLAEGLGIQVRFEPMGEEKGGLLRLRGKQVLLINEALLEEEKATVLAEALSTLDLGQVYLLPEVRDFVEKARKGRGDSARAQEISGPP